jgi:hypothetical protein
MGIRPERHPTHGREPAFHLTSHAWEQVEDPGGRREPGGDGGASGSVRTAPDRGFAGPASWMLDEF